ncbi:hypothetical protein WJ02_15235 [Burkholderia vietnamiensis]|nr:hypothetical protein WJ02_15235 [Burkholderia vietnamiensis]
MGDDVAVIVAVRDSDGAHGWMKRAGMDDAMVGARAGGRSGLRLGGCYRRRAVRLVPAVDSGLVLPLPLAIALARALALALAAALASGLVLPLPLAWAWAWAWALPLAPAWPSSLASPMAMPSPRASVSALA